MSYKYTVKIESDSHGAYIFSVPALHGIKSACDTLSDVERRAHRLISLYLGFLDEMGKPHPPDVQHRAVKQPKYIKVKGIVSRQKRRTDIEWDDNSAPESRLVRMGEMIPPGHNSSARKAKRTIPDDYFLREAQALSFSYEHDEDIEELRHILRLLADDFIYIGKHYKLIKRKTSKK